MSTELDHYKDLVGKVPAEKIAETSGVPLPEVEAWLAALEGEKAGDQVSEKKPDPKAPKAPKAPKGSGSNRRAASTPPARRGRIESIQVVRTTAISIETQKGHRLRIPVPRSIYRGELARKYARFLDEDEYTVLSYAE